jgi:ABC-type spermidine/putrescine transport system permease subunit I
MTTDDDLDREAGLKAWYANLVSTGWVIPAFVATWALVVILPLIIIVFYSFFSIKSYQVVYEPTVKSWVSLIESGRWIAALRTLRVAFTITAIELLIAFPFALWLAKGCRSKSVKAIVITLLTIPFFLDAPSRIIIWRAILGSNGIINTILIHLGAVDTPLEWLLFSEFAVHFGMIGPYFPTMVFPIFLVLTLIDDEYIQASYDLGASPGQTLVSVILPLALPGIIAGIVFTLVPLMAAWVEPQMLGGGFVNLLGASVEAALRELKYPIAAALSTVVIAMLALLLALMIVISRKRADLSSIFQAMRR